MLVVLNLPLIRHVLQAAAVPLRLTVVSRHHRAQRDRVRLLANNPFDVYCAGGARRSSATCSPAQTSRAWRKLPARLRAGADVCEDHFRRSLLLSRGDPMIFPRSIRSRQHYFGLAAVSLRPGAVRSCGARAKGRCRNSEVALGPIRTILARVDAAKRQGTG